MNYNDTCLSSRFLYFFYYSAKSDLLIFIWKLSSVLVNMEYGFLFAFSPCLVLAQVHSHWFCHWIIPPLCCVSTYVSDTFFSSCRDGSIALEHQ